MEITVKEAIAELEKRKEFLTAQCDGCWDPAIEMALQALKAQRTGKWIKIHPQGIYECSECHQNVMTSDIDCYKFCHQCGARMDEE